MSRTRVVIAYVYFIAMMVFITFPGVGFANRIEPYIFGLPFVLAWYMGWIVGSVLVFTLLYRDTRRS